MPAPTTTLTPFLFDHPGRIVGRRGRAAETPDTPVDLDVLAAVNRFALRALSPDEFAVFTLDLCHNQIDRHFSRFPEEALETINRLTPGRPLMERHDLRGSLPRGTFFRSELHRDGERLSVRPEVYVLRTGDNRDFILNIEGGVYRETSIGFSFRTPECSICGKDLRTCAHEPGRNYNGNPCHFILRDVLEVIEGSVVPAGSQGTGFVASRDRLWRPAPLLSALDALDTERRLFHQPIELQTTPRYGFHDPAAPRAVPGLLPDPATARAVPGLLHDPAAPRVVPGLLHDPAAPRAAPARPWSDE